MRSFHEKFVSFDDSLDELMFNSDVHYISMEIGWRCLNDWTVFSCELVFNWDLYKQWMSYMLHTYRWIQC